MKIVPIIGSGIDASDTSQVTLDWVKAVKAAGHQWVAFDMLNPGWSQATQWAIDEGLVVLPYQGYDAADFSIPDEAERRALLVVEILDKAGIPKGAPAALDFESVHVAEIQAIQWAEDWAATISGHGHVPGIYLGDPTTLTTAGVKLLRNFQFLWRSCSASTPGEGWDLMQTECGSNLDGISVDLDIAVAGGKAVGLQKDLVVMPERVSSFYVAKTLAETAVAVKVPLDVLCRYNGIKPTDKVEQVKVPEVYRVKSGDTLSGIAQKYGVKDTELAMWNGISLSTPIWIGQMLYV